MFAIYIIGSRHKQFSVWRALQFLLLGELMLWSAVEHTHVLGRFHICEVRARRASIKCLSVCMYVCIFAVCVYILNTYTHFFSLHVRLKKKRRIPKETAERSPGVSRLSFTVLPKKSPGFRNIWLKKSPGS